MGADATEREGLVDDNHVEVIRERSIEMPKAGNTVSVRTAGCVRGRAGHRDAVEEEDRFGKLRFELFQRVGTLQSRTADKISSEGRVPLSHEVAVRPIGYHVPRVRGGGEPLFQGGTGCYDRHSSRCLTINGLRSL